MKKKLIWISLIAVIAVAGAVAFTKPCYKNIDGWTAEQNKFLKDYLYETRKVKGRKVAVLDIDGTLIGQVPYYLADEAILDYAARNESSLSDEQKKAVKYMIKSSDTAADNYTQQRITFLAGMSPTDMAKLGAEVWDRKFLDKVYPEMQQFVRNLHRFGYDVYGITCSPEYLYQDVVTKYFNIPIDHVLGRKGIVKDTKMTTENFYPVTCHEGKADTVWTLVKDAPMIAAGNSSGDAAMVATSVGIKIWVNPSEILAEGCHADANCIVVRSNDVDEGLDMAARDAGIKPNKPELKDK
ncbi:MAG: haloacid dehalogenase-like hydrolase [Alphaproteobacteria bacterium]|nr:haloacid dehalogenase-like hydrolase [Alphaproteobacteria bacterium]